MSLNGGKSSSPQRGLLCPGPPRRHLGLTQLESRSATMPEFCLKLKSLARDDSSDPLQLLRKA